MVNGMLKVFSIYVYVLLHPDATLYFVTLIVAKMFFNLPDILHEAHIVSTPVGESVVAKRVYRNCPLTFQMIPLYSGRGEILFLEGVSYLV